MKTILNVLAITIAFVFSILNISCHSELPKSTIQRVKVLNKYITYNPNSTSIDAHLYVIDLDSQIVFDIKNNVILFNTYEKNDTCIYNP
jgi:hypothetical protein